MPKSKRENVGRAKRHAPLEAVIERDVNRKFVRTRDKKRVKQAKREEREKEPEENIVSVEMSRKIMTFAREQLEEERSELKKHQKESGKQDKVMESDDDDDDDDIEEVDQKQEAKYLNEDEYVDLEVREEDERALEAFMNKKTTERRTLGDILMEKIREKEARDAAKAPKYDENGVRRPGLDPKLAEVYRSIGKLLRRYRAGKIPKAFKIIPALRNWEEVLVLTDPDHWSPQAMSAATRLFASNLNKKMAQRFYALVLLPAVREDIFANKKLHYHLYMALKKSMYRPGAFFKGILLPLCESGDCSLREAAIIASIMKKVSIPMMHSAAAMLKMSSMEYSGATSLFLRVLLNKKYSLPYKVIDTLVKHFIAFRKEKRVLPVLWHQSLLVFAERYKTTLTTEQKEALKPLLRQHFHHQITPEIRRELFFSVARDTTTKF